MKDIKRRLEIGYTMAVYGTREAIHKQMLKDIKCLLAENEALRKDAVYGRSEQIINYIENEAEIAMPVNELMHESGRHLTKKEYGQVLLKYLVIELREHFL